MDWNESWVTVGTRLRTGLVAEGGEEGGGRGRGQEKVGVRGGRSRYKKSSRIRLRVARSRAGDEGVRLA